MPSIPTNLLENPPALPWAERLVTIPAGHLVHAARPAEFTAAVAGFLGRPPR
jgi:pimeloyl-ACP methyl ester carboxylesterase